VLAEYSKLPSREELCVSKKIYGDRERLEKSERYRRIIVPRAVLILRQDVIKIGRPPARGQRHRSGTGMESCPSTRGEIQEGCVETKLIAPTAGSSLSQQSWPCSVTSSTHLSRVTVAPSTCEMTAEGAYSQKLQSPPKCPMQSYDTWTARARADKGVFPCKGGTKLEATLVEYFDRVFMSCCAA
jgi:hypothetical protein